MDIKPNESNASEENIELPKLEFKRIKHPLDQVVKVAIPLHVTSLYEQWANIENLKDEHRLLALRAEQIKASKTVHLLKQDIVELENLNRQVRDEDQDLFHKTVESSIRDAVEALSNFMSLHSDILGPFLDIDNGSEDTTTDFPKVICDLNTASPDDIQDNQKLLVTQLDIEPKACVTSSNRWGFLKKELIEIHDLIRHFSSLIFRQQDSVDLIQSNIVQTHENVKAGNEYLKKASLLKAAAFPLTGALIGGLVLGPIGLFAGLKLFTCVGVAASGGAVGYATGTHLKKKRQASCDIELKALTYPSPSTSVSTPDLSVIEEIKKEN